MRCSEQLKYRVKKSFLYVVELFMDTCTWVLGGVSSVREQSRVNTYSLSR